MSTSLALLSGPLPMADLQATLNQLILNVNAADSTSLALLSGPPDPSAIQATLYNLILRFNAGGSSIAEIVGPLDPANLEMTLNSLILEFNAGGGGGSSYTGPLDIVPGAVVAYSQRAMAAAWVSDAITIRRDSDDATMSFATTTNNAVDADAVTAFLGGANGFVSSWLDQSGNSCDFDVFPSIEPTWNASVQGGKPGLQAVGGVALNSTINMSLLAGAYTIFAIANRDFKCGSDSGADDYVEMGGGNGNIYLDAEVTPNIAGGSSSDAISDNTVKIFEAAWEFGSRAYLIDGVDIPLSDDDDGAGLGAMAGISYFNLAADAGIVAEYIFYNSVLSPTNRLAVRQNIAAYYGITLG